MHLPSVPLLLEYNAQKIVLPKQKPRRANYIVITLVVLLTVSALLVASFYYVNYRRTKRRLDNEVKEVRSQGQELQFVTESPQVKKYGRFENATEYTQEN